MTSEEAEEYSTSIGQIGEGWWRQIAWAQKQGIPKALGMSNREWGQKYHGYLKISPQERLEAEKELLADDPNMSQKQIADVLGVGEATVNRDLNPPNGAEAEQSFEEEEELDPPNGAETERSASEDKDELEQIRWCATRNMVGAITPLDRPISEAHECASYYDPKFARGPREKITPMRARRAAAFLQAYADELEQLQ